MKTKRRFWERQVLVLIEMTLKIRAADAKEVGVGNPAEETCCYPNKINVTSSQLFVNKLSPNVQQQTPPCESLGFTPPDFALNYRHGRVANGRTILWS
jgi:hypothetical protein